MTFALGHLFVLVQKKSGDPLNLAEHTPLHPPPLRRWLGIRDPRLRWWDAYSKTGKRVLSHEPRTVSSKWSL